MKTLSPILTWLRQAKLLQGFVLSFLVWDACLWVILWLAKPGPRQLEADWPQVQVLLYLTSGIPFALLMGWAKTVLDAGQERAKVYQSRIDEWEKAAREPMTRTQVSELFDTIITYAKAQGTTRQVNYLLCYLNGRLTGTKDQSTPSQ